MSNIFKCQDCGKTLIEEEQFSHECVFGVVEIPVLYYYEVVKDGENVVVAKGTNGRFYRLVNQSPTEAGQPRRPTVNGTICPRELDMLFRKHYVYLMR